MTPKAKILVVDDDPNIQKTLSDILRLKGYETATASTGAEAIAAAASQVFSLALIDLILPDMRGLEVMLEIKAISRLTDAIILTGHATLDTAIAAVRDGAFSYHHKPCDIADLLDKIGQAIELQEAQLEIARLASFPQLHPSPVFELDPAGAVIYANPATDILFPDLRGKGLSHALLEEAGERISALRESRVRQEIRCEAEVDGAAYELQISFVGEANLIRIYVNDITSRKLVELETHRLATTDSLTGVANRYEFMRVLHTEMARSDRHGTPLSLVMYDIDHFKNVNDSLGHGAGDAVLQAITAAVIKTVRVSDTIARWGGDEFMILMPQSDLDGALSAAKKLRHSIVQCRSNKTGPITASFGVTEFAADQSSDDFLRMVDEALYKAKDNGRDRIESVTHVVRSGQLVA